jgi:hypothetical protein
VAGLLEFSNMNSTICRALCIATDFDTVTAETLTLQSTPQGGVCLATAGFLDPTIEKVISSTTS